MIRTCLGAALLLGMVCAAGFAQAEPSEKKVPKEKREKAPRFTLMDSYDKPFAFSFPREMPVLLSLADQGAQSQVDPWRVPLEKRYGKSLEYQAVAWLEAIPSILHGAVKKVIQEGYDWVLLDWNGAVAKRYRCKASAANIFVIGRDGYILFEHHGEVSQKHLDTIYEILDRHLKPVDES